MAFVLCRECDEPNLPGHPERKSGPGRGIGCQRNILEFVAVTTPLLRIESAQRIFLRGWQCASRGETASAEGHPRSAAAALFASFHNPYRKSSRTEAGSI